MGTARPHTSLESKTAARTEVDTLTTWTPLEQYLFFPSSEWYGDDEKELDLSVWLTLDLTGEE